MTRNHPELPRLWTCEEVAERYGVTTKTLQNWRSLGIGPRSVKVGHGVRYRTADLSEWEAENVTPKSTKKRG